ncbi:hypothetical protein AB1E18_018949 [Capra hircus]
MFPCTQDGFLGFVAGSAEQVGLLMLHVRMTQPGEELPGKMRQLKGKPKKETSRDKKERKQAMQEARRQITTVVLPTLAVVVLLIVVFVYVATRPASAE